MSEWRQPAIVAVVAAVTMFTALGWPQLWDRDEPRNARCAVEMRERGDWIVPTFNGELRAHKPVLLYWLIMSAYEIFGPTEFAARFWSAVLGVGTVLVTYRLGCLLFSPRAGLWAGLAMATNLNFVVAARAATPDSVLIFFTTAAVYFFFAALGWRDDGVAIESRWRLVGSYVCMGLAVLAKGPIGVVLPLGTIGLALLYASDSESTVVSVWARLLRPFRPSHVLRRAMLLRPLWLVAIVVAVAAPWYVAVHVQTGGAWTAEFFLEHHLARATSPMESHDGPIFYYIVALLAGFFPWSVFAAPVLVEIVQGATSASSVEARQGEAARFPYRVLACWTVWCVGLFSLAGTKLPSYILPAYPAVALATGAFLDRWLAGVQAAAAWWMKAAFGVLAAVGAALMIGLCIAIALVLPGDEILAAIGLVPLVGGVGGLLLVYRERRQAAVIWTACGAAVLALAAFGPATMHVDRHQVSESIIRDIAARIPLAERPEILAYRNLEPSVVFYAGTRVPILMSAGEVAATFRRSARPFALIHEEDWSEIRTALPADAVVLSEYSRFLKPGRILVVGRDPSSQQTASAGRKIR
jgi:4-amino-4-deoxy-L-arabinose transferase-like glycosyltransferase